MLSQNLQSTTALTTPLAPVPPNKNAKRFDEYDSIGADKDDTVAIAAGEELVGLQGGDEQVMLASSVMNKGKAIVSNDLYPTQAEYLLHEIPGYIKISVYKESKSDFWFAVDVDDVAYNHYSQVELPRKKDASDRKKAISGESTWYDVPPWIMFDLLLNHGVHPRLNETEFEAALWSMYPKLWLDPERAPRR